MISSSSPTSTPPFSNVVQTTTNEPHSINCRYHSFRTMAQGGWSSTLHENYPLILCQPFTSLAPIPANSPAFGRSLRLFHLTKIAVRGDSNLRLLSTDEFCSCFWDIIIFIFFGIPVEWVLKSCDENQAKCVTL